LGYEYEVNANETATKGRSFTALQQQLPRLPKKQKQREGWGKGWGGGSKQGI